jgi:NitT/TauT family transport system substrate-binding protein
VKRGHFLGSAAAPLLAGSAAMPARAQALPVLRVAAVVSDTFGEAYYANERGFFQTAGLSVEVTTLGNGGAVATAVASGTMDIGVTNGLTLASAFLRNIPFIFLTSGGLHNPNANQLCVAQNSPIRTAKDTEGQTFAISSLRGTEWLALQGWIDAHGGDSTKVKLVELPYAEIGPAAIRGTIAGGMLTEPYLSMTKAAGGIRTVAPAFNVMGRRLMLSGWFTTTTWLHANPHLAKRFAEAIYTTARWANSHHDESAQMLAKYAKIDLAVLRTMARCPYGETLTPANLQSAYDLAYKYKAFDRPVDAHDVIAKL